MGSFAIDTQMPVVIFFGTIGSGAIWMECQDCNGQMGSREKVKVMMMMMMRRRRMMMMIVIVRMIDVDAHNGEF